MQLAAAGRVSRRWLGLIEVPPELEKSLADTSRDLGVGGGRQLRRSGRQLVDVLRQNARTSSKGGLGAVPVLDPESGMRTRPRRRRGSERMTLRQLRQSAAAPFDVQPEDADTEAEEPAYDFLLEPVDAGTRAWHCHRLHRSCGVKSTILKR